MIPNRVNNNRAGLTRSGLRNNMIPSEVPNDVPSDVPLTTLKEEDLIEYWSSKLP